MLEGYAAHVRPGPGVCYLPDGDAVYRHHILAYTNLPEDPRAVHDYGLARLDEIEAAEAPIAAELGHESVASLRVFLDRDPANHVEDPADLVKAAEEWILRAEAEAPTWFGNPPAEHCVVQAVEPHMERDAPAAFYYPPAEDGSRPGTYFFNTYDPPSRPLHQAVPMTYHEAVPGHHFQLTVERHLDELPAFRRHGALLACGAYVEGWALYAERLAAEMGLYHTPAGTLRGLGIGSAPGCAPGGRHRAARLRLDPAAVHRPARGARGPGAPGCRDRDRPLHRLARPGPQLHDRPARESLDCVPSWRRATATASTSEPSTTRSSVTARCRSTCCASSCRAGSSPGRLARRRSPPSAQASVSSSSAAPSRSISSAVL